MESPLKKLENLLVKNAYHFMEYVQMEFEGNIGMNINNRFTLDNCKSVNYLVGHRVLRIDDQKEKIIFEFDGDIILTIDLTNAGYIGDDGFVNPEALELFLPDSPVPIVWN